MLRHLPLGLALTAASLSACQCTDPEDFFGIPDAGPPAEADAGPPPPVFPLKKDDVVVIRGMGGRNGTGSCAGTPGDCERTLQATYTVQNVSLDDETNRWTVRAAYLYEMNVANVDVGVIDPLFLSKAANFDLNVQQADDGEADFNTDGAPVDGASGSERLLPNDVPFFHYEAVYAGQEGSAYDAAADAFRARVLSLDPDAEIETKPAEAKLEAYFKDDRVSPPALHKIRVDLHPFGFICSWDERMIPWNDSMQRAESDFNGAEAGLTAVFTAPIRLYREDVEYACLCNATQKICKSFSDNTCLDPSDPDAEPAACP